MEDDNSCMTEGQNTGRAPRWLELLVVLSLMSTCALSITAYWLLTTLKSLP